MYLCKIQCIYKKPQLFEIYKYPYVQNVLKKNTPIFQVPLKNIQSIFCKIIHLKCVDHDTPLKVEPCITYYDTP